MLETKAMGKVVWRIFKTSRHYRVFLFGYGLLGQLWDIFHWAPERDTYVWHGMEYFVFFRIHAARMSGKHNLSAAMKLCM